MKLEESQNLKDLKKSDEEMRAYFASVKRSLEQEKETKHNKIMKEAEVKAAEFKENYIQEEHRKAGIETDQGTEATLRQFAASIFSK